MPLGAEFRGLLGTAGTSSSSFVIPQSIRFNDNDLAYMSRTPSVAGNRKTWTWSGWVKRGSLGGSQVIFGAGANSSDRALFYFSGDNPTFIISAASVNIGFIKTTQVLRDPSAWYHLVLVVDTTQATAANRLKMYINGEQVTSLSTATYPAQNTDTYINYTEIHRIGSDSATISSLMDGYLADVHFIDGSALAASDFGETDANGSWVPIEFDSSAIAAETVTSSYCTSAVDATDSASYTFSSQSIGTATSDRIVVVTTAQGNVGMTVGSLTVGGISATEAIEITESTGYATSGQWYVPVPTGTTADIVVNISGGTASRCGITVHAIYGSSGKPYATAYAEQDYPLIQSIQVPDNGVIIGASMVNSGAPTVTWTNLTERVDEVIESASSSQSVASDAFATGGSITVTCSPASDNREVLTLTSWGAVGGYGTNGFYIDGADSANLGLDVNAVTSTALTVTFTDSSVDTSNSTAYTFSSQAIGAAGSDRTIVVATNGEGGGASRYVSTLTIGGVSATKIVSSLSENLYWPCEMWKAVVPTGTTADIIVTWDSNMSECGLGVWDVRNMGGVFSSGTDSTDPGNTTLWIPAGGVGIGSMKSGGGVASYTWTGLTKDYDELVDSANNGYHSGASITNATAQSLAIEANPSGGSQFAFCAVSFVMANDNSFAPSGLTTADQMLDSPTDDAANGIGNYCTWNVLNNSGPGYTWSNGNLKSTSDAQGQDGASGTLHASSGKYYFEYTVDAIVTGGTVYGVCTDGCAASSDMVDGTVAGGMDLYGGGEVYGYRGTGGKVDISSDTAYGTSFVATDVIGVALDLDNGIIWFSKNGAWQESATQGEIEAGTTTNAAFTWTPAGQFWTIWMHDFGANSSGTFNGGQSGFTYTPPTGFKALCTANLPAPTITDPSAYNQTELFTGNSATNVITFSGNSTMQPDLVWIKRRDWLGSNHVITDSVRGVTKEINSDLTNAESTEATGLTSFDTNGFTIGSHGDYNTSGKLQVAWCWKAGGAGVSNTDGSVTSTVSADTTSGFSIAKYTGLDAAITVGHGLSSAPEFIIVRNLSAVASWAVYHKDMTGATYYLTLDTTVAQAGPDASIFSAAPTATILNIGNSIRTSRASENFIAYSWHSVSGFSAFGTYTGNGLADGPFVHCGFRPAFIMIKNITSAGSWNLIDVKRDNYNVVSRRLLAQAPDVEVTGGTYMDITSNGFKRRSTNFNTDTEIYLYAAFAEHPFGGDGVSQARAR